MRITIKSLQAQIENLKAELQDECVLRQHNETAMQHIINQRDNEIQDLTRARAALSQDLLLAVDLIQPGFKGEIHQFLMSKVKEAHKPQNPQADKLVQGGRDPVVIHSDPVAVLKGMEWALGRVKFQSSVQPEFFENFVVSINKEGRWFAFLPLKENAETKQFASEFVRCARKAGFEKANYKQGGGAWFIY